MEERRFDSGSVHYKGADDDEYIEFGATRIIVNGDGSVEYTAQIGERIGERQYLPPGRLIRISGTQTMVP